MTDIKLREVNRGSIKTLDLAEAASNRMKDSYVRSKLRTKEEAIGTENEDEKTPATAAYDEMNASAVAAEQAAESMIGKTIKTIDRENDETFAADEGKDPTERGREKFKKDRIEERGKDRRVRDRTDSGLQKTGGASRQNTRTKKDGHSRAESVQGGTQLQRQRDYWRRKTLQNRTEGDLFHRIKEIIFGDSRKSRSGRSLRAAVNSINLQNLTITAASSIAVLIIVLFTFFGSAFYSPGGEEYSDDPTMWNVYGNGSTALVNVARKEIGNVGGDKFWRWYGFSSHVHWCACFVSWCENECGYLKADAAPKFAVVSGGASWFKKKGQWAGRSYTPKPGDIIFFDWESDGELDHVGIVESSDGKTVHTIEGNSGNACRRQVYTRGRSPIVGYGLIYSAPSRKAQQISSKAIALAYPDSPPEAKYPSGRATPAFAAALDRAYPDHSHWGKATSVGASCDVFVGVCVVDSGVDPNFPRGLAKQQPYLASSDKFECVIKTSTSDIKESELRDGDIITYSYTKGGGHICIYAGGKLRHAAYNKWYGRTSGPGGRLKIKGKNWIRVYRAKG